jgi:hypothetical protein
MKLASRCNSSYVHLPPSPLVALASMWGRSEALLLSLLVSIGMVTTWTALAETVGNVATARLLRTPNLPMPAYLESVVDPVFGTTVMRVTDPGRELLPGVRCDPRYCRHRYSSTQAWNADQSLLVIAKGCADLCFLDGHTYKPLFSRRLPPHHDCKWHSQDPKIMICVHHDGIDIWTPRTNGWKQVFRSVNYNRLEFGPYKGNPSHDGNRIAVRAKNGEQRMVAFAYDLATKEKYPDIDLSDLVGVNLYVTISSSGRYIFVSQLTSDDKEPAYIFTVDGARVKHWPEHHRPGHGDLAIDSDGSDVYIGISKSPPDKFHVIKRRLEDGKVTSLIPYGDASHASARNIRWPGWVFLSYQGTFEHTSAMRYPAPFYREVVALRIDGSGEIRRIAQTRSAMQEYLSEMHASPSPDGSKVIWASNWGVVGGPISNYVTVLNQR